MVKSNSFLVKGKFLERRLKKHPYLKLRRYQEMWPSVAPLEKRQPVEYWYHLEKDRLDLSFVTKKFLISAIKKIRKNLAWVKKRLEDEVIIIDRIYSFPSSPIYGQAGEILPVDNFKFCQTVWLTGFLVDQSQIRAVDHGFEVNSQAKIRPVLEIVSKRLKKKRGFLFNFGFWETPNLLEKLPYAHNRILEKIGREKEKIYSPEGCAILGPFLNFIGGKLVAGLPLFSRSFVAWDDRFQIKVGLLPNCFDGRIVFPKIKKIDFSSVQINSSKVDSLPLAIYTPSFSSFKTRKIEKMILQNRHFTGWQNFWETVGKERINFVVTSNSYRGKLTWLLHFIRKGEVVLPPAGIVISFRPEFFRTIFSSFGINFNADGYWRPARRCQFSFETDFGFNNRKGSDKRNNLRGLIGGGALLLVRDGKTMVSSKQETLLWLRKNFYFHPRWLLAQEGRRDWVEERTPNIFLVKTKKNRIGVFVFSGRAEVSIGVNLWEGLEIIKQMLLEYQDQWQTVLQLDEGSAVTLVYFEDKKPHLLNLTAIGPRNFSGEFGGFADWLAISFSEKTSAS